MVQSFNELGREEVRGLPSYVPGKPIEEVKRELGLEEVIKLASNENPWGPSPRAVEAMNHALSQIHRYPDASAYDLTTELSQSFGLSREHFLIGNGSDQIIQMIAQAFFRAGDEILMGKPSFPRYATVSKIMGAKPIELECVDGYYPLQQIAERVTDQTRAVFICNPNNPTGTAFGEDELRDFVNKIPENVVLIFDEAYYEFAESSFSGTAFIGKERPVIVMRTFSKAFGLAGLRVGFAISSPELIDAINRVRDPFNASVPALAGALAAWQDKEYLQEIIGKNREQRERLTQALEEMGIKVFSSQTNFVMAFFPEDGGQLGNDLLKQGIIVRPGGIFGYPNGLRITVGTEEENTKVLNALKERYIK